MKLAVPEADAPDISIAPLIDMVFLLIVYFMVTASLVPSEADLGIRLPGMLAQAEAVDLPDEQMIEVRSSGHVVLNGREFDTPDSVELPGLLATLVRYRLASEAAGVPPLITILSDGDTRHQRVIDVMNVCAAANIKNVTFSLAGDT